VRAGWNGKCGIRPEMRGDRTAVCVGVCCVCVCGGLGLGWVGERGDCAGLL
jgi:hypothetical protein